MKVSVLLILLSLSASSLSQSITGTDTLQFDSDITCLCGNLRNEIYLGLDNGEIVKTSSDGKIYQRFSYPNLGAPSAINCANPLKIFVFFETTQQYLFLDRFSVRPSVYTTQNVFFDRTDYLELAADQSLWSISSPGLELRQHVNEITTELYLLQSLLSEDENITGLYAVGNEMILKSDSQLMRFNLAGQLLASSKLNSSSFCVSQNEYYYISEKERNLISPAKAFSVPIPEEVDKGIKVDSVVILADRNRLLFYSIR